MKMVLNHQLIHNVRLKFFFVFLFFDLKKVHYFLSESNSWSNHINLNYFSLPIPLGKGFIAKVKNNCYIDITKA